MRGKDEYAELFSRGLKGDKGKNAVYPWLYLRAGLLLLGLAAVFTFIVCIISQSGWSMYRLTLYFASAIVVDTTFLILLFELSPRRNFSLLALTVCALAGGTAAALISAAIWECLPPLNGWLNACAAGIGEEIAKFIPVCACIFITKNRRNPYVGFLIGAAVGTLFSVTENAAYIANNSSTFLMMIATAFARGASGPVSHALWAGIVGWAFARFGPKDYRFYAALLAAMVLHTAWDLPLSPLFMAADYFACTAAGGAIGLAIIISERKLAEKEESGEAVKSNAAATAPAKMPALSRLALVLFGAALSLAVIVLGCVFDIRDTEKMRFSDANALIDWAQDGHAFSVDYERQFEKHAADHNDYQETYFQGHLWVDVQQEPTDYDNFSLLYVYEAQGADGNLVLDRVLLQRNIDGNLVTNIDERQVTVAGYYETIRFFPVNFAAATVSQRTLSYSDGGFWLDTGREILRPSTATICALAMVGFIIVLGAVVVIVLRYNEKRAATKNV